MEPVPSARGWPGSLLWVNVRLLHPLIGGDRLRTYHMLRRLKRHCHIRYLCPLTPADSSEAVEHAAEYCDELVTWPHDPVRSGSPAFYVRALANAVFGRRPFSCAKYANPEARRILAECLREARPGEVVVADYLMSFIHFDGLDLPARSPLVVFQHNLESLIWERHVQTARDPLRRFVCARERDLTRAFEDEVARRADGQIAVSEEEERAFREDRGMANVLGWVPTGVDCDYFQQVAPLAEGPPTLVFLGSMDWQANVEAIRHFVEHSLPRIRQAVPATRLMLLGRNPVPALRELAARDPLLEVTGTVEDVRPHLKRSTLMILPLRVGGGTRIKVFEGMAASLPVVSTRVGVEGLPVVDGVHALLADTPEAFADAVIALLQDPARRVGLARTARAWVEAEFSWERAARQFLDLCARVG
jgi:glycosyltransferase involved in cell wall biosynthesis